MKHLFKTTVLAAFIAGSVTVAQAQTSTSSSSTNAPNRAVRLSVGPEFGLPVGNLSDYSDWSFGGSVQVDLPVADALYVTGNAGFNNFFSKSVGGIDLPDLQLLPVKAGLKYFPAKNFYVQGEAGASFILNSGDNKTAAFVYAPQVGVLFPFSDKTYLDAGIRFEGNTKLSEGGSAANFLGLRVAYAFEL
ncbi:MAG: outer membrane beta-barrel protein [Mucilaginibacter polytrichastri]|nr:outer membrane beta-barrel protein [Mucilaginibacter polytrichastri]